MTPTEFQKALATANLSPHWSILGEGDDACYSLQLQWWQSFQIMLADDGKWGVWHTDHDSGIDDDNKSTSSVDNWEETFDIWQEAAKAVEKYAKVYG